MKTVQVSLTVEDEALFLDFQKWHSNFAKLAKAGAFAIRNGSFTVHMDNDGNIRRVQRSDDLQIS